MNGEEDVREIFKKAIGESRGKNYVFGCTSQDVHKFFQYVSKMHWNKNKKKVEYRFRRCGGKYQWTVNNLAKQLSRKGKYVMLGATRKTCEAHKSLFKTVARADDDEKMAVWGNQKQIRMDHAIGVTVESDGQGTIYDNGCKPTGQKVLSPQSLAERMHCIHECFFLDLFVSK